MLLLSPCMSDQQSDDDQRRDKLLLRLLKTPPQSRFETSGERTRRVKGKSASPNIRKASKREAKSKTSTPLQEAIKGIAAAGITPVPLEVVVALAKTIGPHTMRAYYRDGELMEADIMFADGRGMKFTK